jgi:hypothetical protein
MLRRRPSALLEINKFLSFILSAWYMFSLKFKEILGVLSAIGNRKW